MVWVAYDRAIRSAIRFGLDGPVERWRAMQKSVKDEVVKVMTNQLAPLRNLLVQRSSTPVFYSCRSSASCRASDERVRSTVAAIEHKLTQDGLVMRYEEDSGSAFLPCSFWMVLSSSSSIGATMLLTY